MNIDLTKGKCLFFSLSFVVLLLGAVHAQTFTGGGFTIVDNGGRNAASCSIVPVSGVTGDRNVRTVSLTNIAHSFLGDLEVRVYPPLAAAPPSTTGSFNISSPPDGRQCNLSGTYRFIDSAAQSIDAATVGCANATNLAPGDYRRSTYGGGTANGPLGTFIPGLGTYTPAQANGNWRVCVFDFAVGNGGTVLGTSVTLVSTSPTAASVSISGRIVTAEGRGITNARMTIEDGAGTKRSVLTGSFGYYRFDGLDAGSTYILSVESKRYSFGTSSLVISANDNIEDAHFTANQ